MIHIYDASISYSKNSIVIRKLFLGDQYEGKILYRAKVDLPVMSDPPEMNGELWQQIGALETFGDDTFTTDHVEVHPQFPNFKAKIVTIDRELIAKRFEEPIRQLVDDVKALKSEITTLKEELARLKG